jgi:hypothetical protein
VGNGTKTNDKKRVYCLLYLYCPCIMGIKLNCKIFYE